MKQYAVIRELAQLISVAAEKTINDFNEKVIEQETNFTDRLLARIQDAINGYSNKGIIWKGKVLTDRGYNAQEKRFGADFAGLLKIDLNDYEVSKGFLAQAKLINYGKISKKEIERLREQCKRMLEVTSHSYVFIYNRCKIRVVPAISVLSMKELSLELLLSKLYNISLANFYENHFKSFIGDLRIAGDMFDIRQLHQLINQNIRTALVIEAREEILTD